MGLKYFDAFSGIGGFALAIRSVIPEAECVGYSEIDKWAIQVYGNHFKEAFNFGNITQINPESIPDFDLFVGGFPCQPFSVAGKREGTDDHRGELFYDIIRILSVKKPKYVLLENVPGLLTIKDSNNNYIFDQFMEELCGVGYVIDFRILNAKYFGVPQNRNRLYILAIHEVYINYDEII